MMRRTLLTAALFTLINSARAEDQGYRYDRVRNACLNAEKKQGYNPDHFGECGLLADKDYANTSYAGLALKGAKLMNVSFRQASLRGADLQGVQCENCSFEYADLTGAGLARMKAKKSYFVGATMVGASLDAAGFQQSDFSGCNLHRATLNGTAFASTYLDGCYLMDTMAQRAQFVLGSINNSQLCGADWGNVGFQRTTMRNARFDSTTRLPFNQQQAEQQGMYYGYCDF